jgi:tetratricopeptide (TPR) repeat protein
MAKKVNPNDKNGQSQPRPLVQPQAQVQLPPAQKPVPPVEPPPPFEPAPVFSPPQPENADMFKRLFGYLAAAALVIMSVMSFSYGISGDEQDMNEYGKKALDFYTSFGTDTSCFRISLDKDGVLKYYGAWFDLTTAVAHKVSPFWEYDTRHLLNSWTGWGAMLFLGLAVGRIAGWRAALIAFGLLFLSPSFFGHSMNNPKDIPFAFAMTFSLYAFIRMMQSMPNPSRRTLFWAALGIGLGIGTRSIGGFMLIGYLGLLLGFDFLRRYGIARLFGKYGITYVGYGLLVVGTGVAIGLLLWPYALTNPMKNIPIAFKNLSHFPLSLRELFGGQHILSANLPRTYLPTYIIIGNPFLIVAAAFASAIILPLFRKNYDRLLLFFMAFAFLFPISYIIYQKSNVYGGWRHVLFVYPPLVGLAALVFETLIQTHKKVLVGLAYTALVGTMGASGYWYVRSHPNQYTYFNFLVGGTEGANANYETDYYFNSMRPTTEWVRTHLLDSLKAGDSIIVATNAIKQLNVYFKDDKRIKLVYTNFYNRHQYDNWQYGIFCTKGAHRDQLINGYYPPKGTIYTNGVGVAVMGFVMKRINTDDWKIQDLTKKGDMQGALAIADNYLKTIDSTDISVRYGYANALMQLGRLDEAEAFAKTNLKFYPEHTGSLGVIGQILAKRGDYAGSTKIFRRLLNENKEVFWAHFFQGINYAQLGNCNMAIAHMDTCIGMNKTFKDAMINGEQIATKCGFTSKAQQYKAMLK